MRAQRHARKVAAMTEEVSVLKDKALEEEEIAGTGEPVVFKPNKQLKAQNAQKRKEAEERAKQQILKEQADKLKAQMQRAAARAAHLAEVERELDVVVEERNAELKAALKALDEAFLLLGQATIAQSAPEVFYTRARLDVDVGDEAEPPPPSLLRSSTRARSCTWR